jgi:hypothetical protein
VVFRHSICLALIGASLHDSQPHNMISHKKLTLSRLALVASITASLAWASSAAGVSSQGGHASGIIYAPTFSTIGRIAGTLTDDSGISYECEGKLDPHVDTFPLWSGYSSTGVVDGTLTPTVAGEGIPEIRFRGIYGMEVDGRGTFHTFLTTPSSAPGKAPALAGSFHGRFRDAATINPQTLLPFKGDFSGQWTLGR